MARRLLMTLSMMSPGLHASELQPVYALKSFFQNTADTLRQLSQEDRRLSSDFDRQTGGVKSADAGMTLFSNEREHESGQCIGTGCNAADASSLQQKRGGLAWNLEAGDDFRIAPSASVVRYQMGMPASLQGSVSPTLPTGLPQTGMGVGFGLDSSWRISPAISAYASAGMTRFDQRKGYEGIMGLSTQFYSSKLFVEARWTEMIQSGGLLESNYGFSNIRIGVARAFGGP